MKTAATVAYREALLLTARSGTELGMIITGVRLTAPGIGVEIKESGG